MNRIDKLSREIKTILAESNGYLLLPSLLVLSLIVLILTPQNVFAWGIFVLLVFRIVMLKHRPIIIVTFLLGFLTLIIVVFHEYTNQTAFIEGEVVGDLYVEPAQLKVNGNLLSGTAVLHTESSKEKVNVFHTIKTEREKEHWKTFKEPLKLRITADLEEPEAARNLHQFDYQAYLYQQRIHWTASINEIYVFQPAEGLLYKIKKVRYNILNTIESGLSDGLMKQYLLAMVFNQKNGIDREVMDGYRKLGVIHLFSISGLHIQFLIRILNRLLLRFGVTKEITSPILLVSIISYGLLIGNGVGIFRAVFANSLVLITQIFQKKLEKKDVFAITIITALWLKPYLVFSIAFQLSYSLAGVLYFLSEPLKQIKVPRMLQPIFLSFIMTTVSFPFLSYHFFEVTWLGMAANIFYTFFFSVCIFPLFWLAALMAVFPATFFVTGMMEAVISPALSGVEWLSNYLADKNLFLMITGRPWLLLYLLLIISVVLLLTAIEQKKKTFLSFCFLLLNIIVFYSAPYLDTSGRVIHLDVGQGDAILFITPFHKEVVLLDTGGRVEFIQEESWKVRHNQDNHAKNLVSSLKGMGIRQLDAVILTHSDQDHLGNLGYLGSQIPIKTLYFSKGMEKTVAFLDELVEMKPLEPTLQAILAPRKIKLGSLSFDILSPTKEGEGTNEDSLVLFSEIGGYKWLFTGDLGELGERELIKRYPNLSVDFLKVGHHGSLSSTSPEFLDNIKAKGAFISVGKNNRYGHPNDEVHSRLKERKMVIFRTDKQGAIHFIYQEEEKMIRTMLQ